MSADDMEVLPPINIVIVCYNCGRDILKLVGDLRSGDYPTDRLSLTIVDNASADDSVELLRRIEGIPSVLIEAGRNLGFGAGCNLAVRHIAGDGLILFLNPDVRLRRDSLTALIRGFYQYPLSGIWGGLTCNADGEPDGKSAWREPSLLGLAAWSFFLDAALRPFGFPGVEAYSPRALLQGPRVDAVSGCFFLIDNDLFHRLGGFDERFFLYSEEIDLCRRARLLGAQPQIIPAAQVMHTGSVTLTSENKLRHLYYSKLLYFRKHWSPVPFRIARMVLNVGTLLRLTALSVLSPLRRDFNHRRKAWWNFFKQQLSWKF
ncbi:glycosyltransferase family 2 protein [Microbulbifer guangxiensis]|uniref:glycosyltransferase family 2 protein n=1 Tax=Microbulbifer guangxiensis TaxID=2904249 RepID=UPI001F36612C|nr:glycosyltransferase family 2 protein [Microbulbifer guangxiensis]